MCWASANTDALEGFRLPVTPTNFHDGDFTGSEWTNNIDLTHPFEVGFSELITVAVGAEARVDTYELKAGDPAVLLRSSGAPVVLRLFGVQRQLQPA